LCATVPKVPSLPAPCAASRPGFSFVVIEKLRQQSVRLLCQSSGFRIEVRNLRFGQQFGCQLEVASIHRALSLTPSALRAMATAFS
jgi:hypothetical protein